MEKVIYPELSYKIVGILFEVYNSLGPGYQEKYYQKAIALALAENKIKFKVEVPITINFKGNKIGQYFLDFLIEEKIILEIKKGNYFSKKNIEQVYAFISEQRS